MGTRCRWVRSSAHANESGAASKLGVLFWRVQRHDEQRAGLPAAASAAQPSDGLWVTFPEMGVKNCRFTSDAKHFCNRPGYPYCPDHMAVIRLPYVRKSRGVDLFGPSKALVGRNFG